MGACFPAAARLLGALKQKRVMLETRFRVRAQPGPGGCRTRAAPVHSASRLAERNQTGSPVAVATGPPPPGRQFAFVQTISNKDLPQQIHSALKWSLV